MAIPFLGALALAAVGSTISAGIAAATSPNVQSPQTKEAARAAIEADLATLPVRRAIEAAYRIGGKTTVPTGKTTTTQWSYEVPDKRGKDGKPISWKKVTSAKKPSGWEGTNFRNVQKVETPETKEVDFTGIGDVQQRARLADKMAANVLETQQEYGVPFAQEARKQLELSDPEGFAARQKLSELIMAEGNRDTSEPVAAGLESQLLAQVQAGENVTPDIANEIAQSMASRKSLGDSPTGDFVGTMGTGLAGKQRKMASTGAGIKFLASGQTNEDKAYQQRQQAMANYANFLAGRTPTAQFGQLRGAQQGATPQYASPSLPNVNANAASQGLNLALGGYSSSLQNLQDQVSPWTLGISSIISGLSTAGKAGWKPLGA